MISRIFMNFYDLHTFVESWKAKKILKTFPLLECSVSTLRRPACSHYSFHIVYYFLELFSGCTILFFQQKRLENVKKKKQQKELFFFKSCSSYSYTSLLFMNANKQENCLHSHVKKSLFEYFTYWSIHTELNWLPL